MGKRIEPWPARQNVSVLIPAEVKAAVFVGAGKPFRIQEFPFPTVEPEGVLVKVRMSTICGSDIHTWQGRREAPLPLILGHEIVGEIEEMGAEVSRDASGNPLAKGDRITWTIMASCGKCYYCHEKKIPQKCCSLFKYGHISSQGQPYLNGGFAEYIYLRPGTGIFKIPAEISDEEAVPLNCATATVVYGLEAIGVEPGDNVVVQGAGMLGINAVALLREGGARKIIVLDKDNQRLRIAEEFGADETINTRNKKPTEIIALVKNRTDEHGVDVVLETCGSPEVIPPGIEMLRIGGRYLLIGTVFPNSDFTLDGYVMTTRMITMKGIHNYDVRHLGEALRFIARTHKKYPFSRLITHRFGLQEIDQAFAVASQRKTFRVAIFSEG